MDSINAISSNRVGRKIKGSIACAVTGLQTQSSINNIAIYPNPSDGKINISYHTENNSPITFDLYDIYGRLVYTIEEDVITHTARNKELNIEHLNNGAYILYIRQNENKKIYKIIKQ